VRGGVVSTSNRYIKKTRKTDATVNRTNAAEKGPTEPAIARPAMNVPPQKKAVNNSFT
jgi:hypothetical protein